MNKLIIYLIIFIFIILFFFINKILYFKNDIIDTNYILTGTVIHGFGYASKIFDYPTANLSVNHDLSVSFIRLLFSCRSLSLKLGSIDILKFWRFLVPVNMVSSKRK